ncbi:T9SS type A sorting domain-containing protein [uncultured Algibacter sp.]|uniref:T9SS type A sorting domain-containing protein n=1 Tax=uncultured Algibacter sp. TaxID=298659 RepID=UPI00262E1852|nr:T9SS type A sorting domain-containing protein [uncultured Algibacter sp.]
MLNYFFKSKQIRYIILLSFLFSVKSFAQPTAPDGKEWVAVSGLTDEFDSWDTSKWFKSLWNYGEPVQMLANNSGVENGNLWIKATLDDSGTNRWFETSRVMSKAYVNYPMYTECRMKTAHISAYNTFWLNEGNSANRDEIDVVELNSKPSASSSQYNSWPYLMQSQYFLVVNNNTERAKGDFDNRNLSNDNPLKGVPWNEEYHTVGVWWKDANNIQFYLDGEPAGSVSTTRNFTRNLRIIWDLWTIDAPGWSGGIAAKNDLLDDDINTMYVDWIHTYTLENQLSINDNKVGKNVQVYPNPVNDILNVKLLTALESDALIQIYNSVGQLVKTQKLIGVNNEISLLELTSGVYYAKISNGGSTDFQSIIKK